jgi:hypothetical protein
MADPVYPTDDANDRPLSIGCLRQRTTPKEGGPVITEHDTWTDYGVRALPNRLLVVNLDPSAAARCPTPADAIDTGQADLLMAGVVTPALAAVWLARADNADLSAVVVSSGPEECVAGAGVLRFVVAIDENTAAGVFSIPCPMSTRCAMPPQPPRRRPGTPSATKTRRLLHSTRRGGRCSVVRHSRRSPRPRHSSSLPTRRHDRYPAPAQPHRAAPCDERCSSRA